MPDNLDRKVKISAIPGIAAIGLIVTGIAGIFHAFGSGSVLGLFVSAVSFGLIYFVSFGK